VSAYTVGDVVYYLSGTETYRHIRRGVVESLSSGGYWVSGYWLPLPPSALYAAEEGAQQARLAYYNREAEEAQKALDNARARLSNAVGWRERAQAEISACT
jgi:hypothetical protein